MEHENLPPPGYVQAYPTVIYPEHELPPGTPVVQVTLEQYPALTRALNLIREDSGGPAWPPQPVTPALARWEPWLDRMEAAVAALRADVPAPEDVEAAARIAAGEGHAYCDSELYTFCNGDYDTMRAIMLRSPELAAASNFLNDFFNGWDTGEVFELDGVFRPDLLHDEA